MRQHNTVIAYNGTPGNDMNKMICIPKENTEVTHKRYIKILPSDITKPIHNLETQFSH